MSKQELPKEFSLGDWSGIFKWAPELAMVSRGRKGAVDFDEVVVDKSNPSDADCDVRQFLELPDLEGRIISNQPESEAGFRI